jgi:hypothetical protein
MLIQNMINQDKFKIMNKNQTPRKTENQEILIKGYAPKDMKVPVHWLYILMRMAHLLATASALPLAILYGKTAGSGLPDMAQWLGWLMASGAAIWTLIYIGLEQYSYPTQLSGAFLFTGGFSLNVLSGLSLSDFVSTYSAYQVFISAIFAQFLFITGIFVRYSWLKIKNQPEGKDLENWYMIFLIAIVLGLGLLLYGLSSPIISRFMNERNTLLLILSAIFFLYHTFSDGKVLWNGSIFNKNTSENQLQDQLHNKWSGFSAIAIILSLLSSGIIAMWDIQ